MTWKVLLLLLGIIVLYLGLGGLAFYFLEKRGEDDVRALTRSRKGSFLESHSCVSYTDMEQFISDVIYAYERGILAVGNASNPSNWNFPSAVFFSGTVITTIGYGHISPSTCEGRAFCVFYAILGIPLMLVMLAGIGEKLRSLTEGIGHRLKVCRGKPKLRRALRAGSIFIIGVLLFLLIPGFIFAQVEGWTYGESVYYGVITLTTIGFGDFVAGPGAKDKDGRAVYRICIWCWIFIGLAWLASVLSALQDCVQDFTLKVGEKVAGKSNHTVTDSDGEDLENDEEREAHMLKPRQQSSSCKETDRSLEEYDLKHELQLNHNGREKATEITAL